MPRDIEDGRAERFPGKFRQYALFGRQASKRDPNGWRMIGRPTSEHKSLRDMMMPQHMLDSNFHGVRWIDSFSDMEFEIRECDVTRSEWRIETQTPREDS